jgi:hypothetical protein
MKIFLLIALLIVSGFNICAQTRVVRDESGAMVTEIDYRSERMLRYKGSVFFKDSVELGTFTVASGQILQKPVLFNVMNQSFLAEFDNKIVPLRNTDLQLGNRFFKNINDSYYETYYDAKIKILVKYTCSQKHYNKWHRDGIPTQFNNDFAGEIVHKKEYFLLFPNNKLRAINLTNYSVTLAIMKEYDGILYHIHQWKKDIRTEKDVIALLEYLSEEKIL